MKAVVLVGGQGTRLRPLTTATPKQMLPVAGRPMIERVVCQLARHGVDEVILSLGYQPDAFLSAYPDGRCAGVAIRYAVEPEPLDTAGGIAFAARSAGLDRTFLVQNGDVITDIDMALLIDFHRRRDAAATISLTPVLDPSRYGVVAFDHDGRVTEFIEKPADGTAPSNLINAGIYVLEPEVLDAIGVGERVSIERATFPALAVAGRLYALASRAEWVDAGTIATYLAANLDQARREDRWIDAHAIVDPAARVTNSVVAAGATVGPGAVVDQAVVMSGAQVCPMATIRDSIVGPGATIGEGAWLEAHTVIGQGAVVKAGAVAIGIRIPEDPT
ncbi:MAG: NDP-sugar synthase [Actinomycetota bacterium]|nr:NDP-sugar synthase [Actinomycetota bacterium]